MLERLRQEHGEILHLGCTQFKSSENHLLLICLSWSLFQECDCFAEKVSLSIHLVTGQSVSQLIEREKKHGAVKEPGG